MKKLENYLKRENEIQYGRRTNLYKDGHLKEIPHYLRIEYKRAIFFKGGLTDYSPLYEWGTGTQLEGRPKVRVRI